MFTFLRTVEGAALPAAGDVAGDFLADETGSSGKTLLGSLVDPPGQGRAGSLPVGSRRKGREVVQDMRVDATVTVGSQICCASKVQMVAILGQVISR